MIHKLLLFKSGSTDPYLNLAIEEQLMNGVEEGCCILYLWQNRNTVVIGRNQNAWKECRVSLLEGEGGHLARRLSGGGAVFHDLGNLNFTFLINEEDYDLDRQLSVIQTACRMLGLEAVRSGRNDVLVDGRKFSGNAFYHSRGKAYHHGTLLVDTDGEKLSRYLSPSKAKLQAKGVESVRSRVANLSEFVPGLTCEQMKGHMAAAFSQVYGLPVEPMGPERLDWTAIDALSRRNAGRDWLYGPRLPLSFECGQRFGWGEVQLQLHVESGIIQEAMVYSDAMDWFLPGAARKALLGCPFDLRTMQNCLSAALPPEPAADLCRLLGEQEI